MEAWFNLQPPGNRMPRELELDYLTFDDILNYTFVPQPRLKYARGPFHESQFKHRSLEKALHNTRHRQQKILASTSFKDLITPDKLASFWHTFYVTEKKSPVDFDYIKLFNYGNLNFHAADLIMKRTSKPPRRPNLNTGWEPDSWCFLCSEHDNLPKHIYLECRISLHIWQILTARPRPEWNEMYASTKYLDELFNLYLKYTFEAFQYQVRMQLQGVSPHPNWIDEYLSNITQIMRQMSRTPPNRFPIANLD